MRINEIHDGLIYNLFLYVGNVKEIDDGNT